MMKLAVGATSRRAVEVAAELGVHQVVASHAQVKIGGGYTGLDQAELVRLVRAGNLAFADVRDARTEVVRDHGYQVEELHADVRAGFDALHLDVETFAYGDQFDKLHQLGLRFGGGPQAVELGGEHTPNDQNIELLRHWYGVFEMPVKRVVYNPGTWTWSDRQSGQLRSSVADVTYDLAHVRALADDYQSDPVTFKFHNCDWLEIRQLKRYREVADVYNVAPELGRLETDAILLTKAPAERADLLNHAYDNGAWRRWFKPNEGTADDRARCALRYLQVTDPVVAAAWSNLSDDDENFVRGELRVWLAPRLAL